jgi:hypothetical protein
MRVGVRDLAVQPVMTEQRTKASGGHRAAALATFERDEQGGGISQWPLDAQIVLVVFKLDPAGQRSQPGGVVARASAAGGSPVEVACGVGDHTSDGVSPVSVAREAV